MSNKTGIRTILNKEIFNILDEYLLDSKNISNEVLIRAGFVCNEHQLSDIISSIKKRNFYSEDEKVEYLYKLLENQNIGKIVNGKFNLIGGQSYNKVKNNNEDCFYSVSKDNDIIVGQFNVKNLNLSINFEFYNLDKILNKLDISENEKILQYYN